MVELEADGLKIIHDNIHTKLFTEHTRGNDIVNLFQITNEKN